MTNDILKLLTIFADKYSGIAFRGALILGSLYLFFWVLKRPGLEKYRVKPLGQHPPKPALELFYVVTTYLVYAFFSTLTVWLIVNKPGLVTMYTTVSDFGWTYTVASFFLFLFYTDTTFYWSHVLMHKMSWLYKTHAHHHKFINVTPFAAYAFHTGEAFLSAGSFFVLTLILPWHPMVLLAYVVFSIFYNGLLHSGYDLFPKKWQTHGVMKWMNTPTHHIYHHQVSNCNYGFVFSFWDKIMKTEKLPQTN